MQSFCCIILHLLCLWSISLKTVQFPNVLQWLDCTSPQDKILIVKKLLSLINMLYVLLGRGLFTYGVWVATGTWCWVKAACSPHQFVFSCRSNQTQILVKHHCQVVIWDGSANPLFWDKGVDYIFSHSGGVIAPSSGQIKIAPVSFWKLLPNEWMTEGSWITITEFIAIYTLKCVQCQELCSC